MTIQNLKTSNNIILECISGSRAYGLATPNSDTDIRGVFVLPKKQFYSLNYSEQVANNTNDIVYYELKKFVELIAKNNPNILELLNVPNDCLLYKHPILNELKPAKIVSKLCQNTFAGYAASQIKKARGLNKKINNPIAEVRKTVLDFCHVIKNNGSISLTTFLKTNNIKQENCGLVNITHMRDMYALFHSTTINYKGIVSLNGNDIKLSSIPKGQKAIAYLSFNKDGYSSYCKDFKEYWAWVNKRNEARYQTTLSHGKNYDSKNMMHTFRLLDMAEEIGLTGKINVKRPNREYLLKIKAGQFEYDELLEIAEEKVASIKAIYLKSTLPPMPDLSYLNDFLIAARTEIYGQ